MLPSPPPSFSPFLTDSSVSLSFTSEPVALFVFSSEACAIEVTFPRIPFNFVKYPSALFLRFSFCWSINPGSFFISTPPANAPASAIFSDWVVESAATLRLSVRVIFAPSAINAFTSRANSLTLTEAPTATPEDEVVPGFASACVCCARAPVIIMFEMPSVIAVEFSFNCSKPVPASVLVDVLSSSSKPRAESIPKFISASVNLKISGAFVSGSKPDSNLSESKSAVGSFFNCSNAVGTVDILAVPAITSRFLAVMVEAPIEDSVVPLTS